MSVQIGSDWTGVSVQILWLSCLAHPLSGHPCPFKFANFRGSTGAGCPFKIFVEEKNVGIRLAAIALAVTDQALEFQLREVATDLLGRLAQLNSNVRLRTPHLPCALIRSLAIS